MKTLICLLLMLTPVAVLFSQTPDSVCAGTTNAIYQLAAGSGNTCHWSLTGGGTIVTTASHDSILINWSSTPGTDTLKVVETNAIGCPGDTNYLPVVRLPLPTVVLSGADSICQFSASFSGKLTMTFTGVSPWTVNYTEDGNARTVSTSSNPYTFNSMVYVTGGVKNYSLNTVTARKGCSGTPSGSATVTVFPKPATSPIIHY